MRHNQDTQDKYQIVPLFSEYQLIYQNILNVYCVMTSLLSMNLNNLSP